MATHSNQFSEKIKYKWKWHLLVGENVRQLTTALLTSYLFRFPFFFCSHNPPGTSIFSYNHKSLILFILNYSHMRQLTVILTHFFWVKELKAITFFLVLFNKLKTNFINSWKFIKFSPLDHPWWIYYRRWGKVKT